MKIGGIMFAFGMSVVLIGLSMDSMASSFATGMTGLFVMWVSLGIIINETKYTDVHVDDIAELKVRK